VKHTLARTLFFGTLAALSLGLPAGSLPGPRSATGAGTPPAERVVYLGRDLSDEAMIVFAAAVAAQGPDALILYDSPKLSPYTKAFLSAYKPARVVPVGAFPGGAAELGERLGVRTAAPVAWTQGQPLQLWQGLFARAERVVVCPAEPRGQLLQAACLAGAARAPLFVTHGPRQELDVLRDRLAEWRTDQVYLVGDAGKLWRALPNVRHVKLADEAAVAAAYRRRLGRHVETLVVANPADTGEGLGGMSALAPWVALQKRAALLLTGKDGNNVAEVVQKALRDERLRQADALVLVANLQAVPMLQRPNPIPADKDPQIEMEPLTPSGPHPFSFATGRLFHEELGTVPLLLARQRLLEGASGPRKALVASNPGGGLSLLETLSRNTAQELRNAGYETTALFGGAVKADELRRLLTSQDLFLWEGHHNTLIRDWDFPAWDEPMRPAFVFLQSCLALKEPKVQLLLSRGAVGVVGSSTRTYSGSGGACSLAFFNALLYDEQTLGGSLRQAKNFLLAYSLLKEKRLGKGATRTGANLRAAWAFTLWGDPTLRLPPPESAAPGLPAIRHEVTGRTIVLALPEEALDKVKTGKYQARMAPNGRLAGLVKKGKDEDGHPLVPFVFAEVHLPKGRPGQVPRLSSRLPATHWVFCWDERRRCGYLLATPRARDTKELRFRVQWQSTETAEREPAAVGP
jgi:hypothetical protein